MGVSETLRIVVELTDNASGKLGGIVKSLGGSVGNLAKGGLMLAGGAAAAGLAALGGGLGVAFNEAMEAQEGLAQLDAVIKSTGGAAGLSQDEVLDLAGSLSKVTRFSDDAVLAGQNILLTFTSIGEEVFPQATEAILDMATKFGGDAKTSAIQLGKALQDPIAGVSALSRIGVTFTEEQKAMIKSLWESGQAAEAQKVILAELSREVGNSARAAGETLPGQLEITKNALLDIAEGVGTTFLPRITTALQGLAPVLIGGLEAAGKFVTDTLAPAFDTIWGAINENILPALGELGAALGEAFGIQGGDLVKTLSEGVANLAAWIAKTLIPAIADFIRWLAEVLPPVVKAVVGFFRDTFIPFMRDQVLPVVRLIWEWMQTNIPPIINAIKDTVSRFLEAIKGFWNTHGEAITSKAKAIWQAVVDVFNWFKDQFKILFDAFRLAREGDWEGFGRKLREVFDNVMKAIADIISNAWENIKTALATLAEKIVTFIRETDWIEVGKSIIRGIIDGVISMQLWAGEKMVEVGGAMLGTLKGFLGIQSPSKVMADQVGVPMIQGVEIGLQRQTKRLGGRSADIYGGMIPQGRQSGGGLALAGAGRGGFAAGGGQPIIQIVYAPAISLASQDEMVSKLAPIIEKVLKGRTWR